MTDVTDALRHARAYASLGWPVLPVLPRGKRPAHGQGIEHATTDPERIEAWFRATPGANVGVRLDVPGLVAVDIDPRNGGPLQLVNELPPTLTAVTGGGGRHLLYRIQDGARPPGKFSQGVDIKHRGYIVCEPSTHSSGGSYKWSGWDVLGGSAPQIADAPPILFATGEGAPPPRRPAGGDQVAEGSRNEYLSRHAFALRRKGLSVPEIEAVLGLRNQQDCAPPLPAHEVHAIAVGKERVGVSSPGLESDFYAHMPSHMYLYVPARELWPAASVNGACEAVIVGDKRIAPAAWLDRNRAVEQIVWCPGEPEVIKDRLMQAAGWIVHQGARVFNVYLPPVEMRGDAQSAAPWLEHVERVYPDDADHIVKWLAHRVQHPGVKCNHALVLGGAQGIGKDTLLEPAKAAVGPWNWSDINPSQMLARFNAWAKAVVVRVSEARDLGEVDRFAFYDHSKTYIAAPPDVVRVDEKHLRETYVANVCGVVITTNHATDGLHLPPDDRRHYVAWSPRERSDFDAGYWTRLYAWMNGGGAGHVAAYLRALDLSAFDPKAPPPKTPAFWNIVAAGEAPDASELRDIIEALGNPVAITLARIIDEASRMKLHGLEDELKDRRGRRTLPHKLERVGYVCVRNPDASDGMFRIGGRRAVVYSPRALSLAEQIRAARGLV